MKTLILGLGNPILSDDSVGCQVAAALRKTPVGTKADICEAGVGGLRLLSLLTGYDRVFIIDAVQFENGIPGKIHRFESEDFTDTIHSGSPHDVNFATALAVGRRSGVPLPETIIIYAIEAGDITTFSETCTPEVAKAILICTDMITNEIRLLPITT